MKQKHYVYNDCTEGGQSGCLTRKQRYIAVGQRGCTLWMTGLSGSGKSTVGKALERRLVLEHRKHVYRLDGDNIRKGMNRDLGFTAADRAESVRRVGEVSSLFADAGNIAIVSLISPYRKDRDMVRQVHKDMDVPFYEVLIDVPLAVVKKRDPKGLYKKAMEGKIKHFTGLSKDAPYEVPLDPELHIHTDKMTVEEEVDVLMKFLLDKGILQGYDTVPGLATPDGGQKIDLTIPPQLIEKASKAADAARKVLISDVDLQWLQVIAEGWAAPLKGFMREGPLLQALHFNSLLVDTYNITGHGGANEKKTDFLDYSTYAQKFDRVDSPIPIVLPINDATKKLIEGQESVTLVTKFGDAVATLKNPEVYAYRKHEIIARVFGSWDMEHPWIKMMMTPGYKWLVGGEIETLGRIKYHDGLDKYRLTPAELEREFTKRDADAVVAFQTRNPTHAGHLSLCHTALQRLKEKGFKKPVLWLSPLGGWTKSDDVPLDVRVKQHEAVLEAGAEAGGLDRATTVMGIWPSPMIYAGPTEVQWHAKSRRNAGAKFFIVGRDPAGLGSSEAWEKLTGDEDVYNGDHGRFVLAMSPGMNDLELMSFGMVYYDKVDQKMKPMDSKRPNDFLKISGTKMRKMAGLGREICEGEIPSDWSKSLACVPPGFMPVEPWKVVVDYYKHKTTKTWEPWSKQRYPQGKYPAVGKGTSQEGEYMTTSYKLLKDGGSFWHDVEYKNAESTEEAPVYNFIVEIPMGTQAKMEVQKSVAGNPIMQDTKHGAVRFYDYGVTFFNYGLFPQTWENPNFKDEETHTIGDNDPIDVIEISGRKFEMGSVVPVKVLGSLRLIDEGETDDKILVLAMDDPDAPSINSIDDFKKVKNTSPDPIDRLIDWLLNYKTMGGSEPNVMTNKNSPTTAVAAVALVEASHKHYLSLVAGKEKHKPEFKLPKRV